MAKQKTSKAKAKTHQEIAGFEIKVNEFGEIVSSMEVTQLNDFLNRTATYKKDTDLSSIETSPNDNDISPTAP